MKLLRLLPLLLVSCTDPTLPTATAETPVRREQVALPGPDGVTLRAILALPEAAPTRATVIALHGCGGLGGPAGAPRLPMREADWAARLTAAGHAVLFPDSFGSRGLGQACGIRDFPAGAEAVRWKDARAAADWAAAQPWAVPGGAVLLGWSHGGSTVLGAVNHPLPGGAIRAAIAFYPGCLATLRAGGWRPEVPLLLLLGGADDWTPATHCQRLAQGSPAAVETYDGAPHGFDAPGGQVRTRTLADGRMVTAGPDPAARAAALARVEGFLARQAP